MIALIQRVSEAAVRVEGEIVGEINHGLLVLLGVERDDDEAKAKRLMERVTSYRVFEDDAGKMNLSVKDVGAVCWWSRSLPCLRIRKRAPVPAFHVARTHKRRSVYTTIFLICVHRFCRQSVDVLRPT